MSAKRTGKSERVKVADLPEFDAAQHLDSEAAIAAYLKDIREANDPALLAAAPDDIARARLEFPDRRTKK